MAKDKFYRDMTDSQLRAAYKEMKKNLNYDYDFWKEEFEMLVNVARERGLELEEDSISAKIETAKGYLEFGSHVKSEESVEYVTRGGKREGAGRPSLGLTKKVSITLPEELWEQIEKARGDQSLSSFLRNVMIDRDWV